MATPQPQFLTYLKVHIATAPAKAATLAALGLILVVVVVVQVLHRPASVDASPAPPMAIEDDVAPLELLPEAQTLAPVDPTDRPEPPELSDTLARDLFSTILSQNPPETIEGMENSDAVSADNHDDVARWTLDATYLAGDAGNEPLAIINGVIVQLQGRIGSYVLNQIEPRYVVLADGNRRFVLPMR